MRRRTAIATIAAALVASAALVSVGLYAKARGPLHTPRAPTVTAAPGTVIKTPGVYHIDDADVELTIWVDGDGLVQYSLVDPAGAELAHSTERASAYSNWEFAVDASRRLWFYSADVGFFVWDGDPDGVSRPIHADAGARALVPEGLRRRLR